jgi:hypothetical protein
MSSGGLADLAVEFAEELGPVFPCAGDKSPLTPHGFKDAALSAEKIYELFSAAPNAALIGIATGDIIAVDIDRKNGKDGFRWPALAELPLTRTQATPSGGEHRLYRLPPGRRLRGSLSGLFEGIDIKADGGYIATGPGYQWTNDEDIAMLSDEQCELLSRPAKMPLPQEGVSAADIAGIDHGNWHEPVLRLIGKLVSKGIDDQTIHALTDRFTLSGYTVAQTRAEVAEMICGARAKGWAPTVPETRQTPFLNPLDVFLADPPDWRVEGLLPERGVGILVGGEGSGKTFVAIDLCMAIANGTAYANNYPTSRGRVLYAAAEDRLGVGARIVAHHQWSGLGVEDIVLWRGISLADTADIEFLEQCGDRFDFVVIDTLSKATPGLDENSNTEMAAAIDRAYRLSAIWGAFVLLVAHSGKEASKGIRGASSLTANVDTVLKCSRPGRGKQVGVTLTKQKSGPEGVALNFSFEPVEVTNTRTGEVTSSLVVKPAGRSAADLCRLVLEEGEMSVQEVFERVTRHSVDPCYSGVTKAAVKQALHRMVQSGEAVNIGGNYGLSAGGEVT